jgi:predicted CopG family antitoxin
MGTKSVRLDEEVYERIQAHKREGETFSEAIDRLTSEYSLLDFAGGYSAEDADRHRELLNQADEQARADRRDRLKRLGLDGE